MTGKELPFIAFAEPSDGQIFFGTYVPMGRVQLLRGEPEMVFETVTRLAMKSPHSDRLLVPDALLEKLPTARRIVCERFAEILADAVESEIR